MSVQYSGRHRAPSAPSARSVGRHRSATVRRRPDVLKPLSISLLSLGATYAIVQTVSAPFGEISQAAPAGRSVAMALVAAPDTPKATPNAAPTSSTSAPEAAEVERPRASGIATAKPSPATRKATTPAAIPSVDISKAWILPLKTYTISSRFGPRWGTTHAGLDLAAPTGTPVMAMSSGTVTLAGWQGGYGNKIEITYWDGTVSHYGHLDRIDVKVGQKVMVGDVVGAVGSTGNSTGPHLHLEVHTDKAAPSKDPEPWLALHGIPVPIG